MRETAEKVHDPVVEQLRKLSERFGGPRTVSDDDLRRAYMELYPKHKSVFFHVVSPTCPKTADVTILALLRALERTPGPLPPNLVIQLDNAANQNKNKYFIQFCGLMVQWQLFKKIRITFLPVGHTHCDVDQMFSRWTSYVAGRDVYTLDEMIAYFEASYTPTPEGSWDKLVPNFIAWLKTGKYLDINGISTVRHIKIYLNPSGSVIAKTKFNDFEKVWSPEHDFIIMAPTSTPVQEKKLRWHPSHPLPEIDFLEANWRRCWYDHLVPEKQG